MTANISSSLLLKVLAAAVLGVGFLGLSFAQLKGAFQFHTLHCSLDDQPCPDYLDAEVQKFAGKSYFFTDVHQRADQILTYLPSLQSYDVQTTFPDQLHFTFHTLPSAYTLQQANGTLLMIDQVGVVTQELDASSAGGLKVFQVNPSAFPQLELHQQLPEQLHRSLQAIAEELQRSNLTWKSAQLIDQQQLELTLENGMTAELRIDDGAAGVQKLAYTLTHVDFTTLKQPTRVIDVRFKYPILKMN